MPCSLNLYKIFIKLNTNISQLIQLVQKFFHTLAFSGFQLKTKQMNLTIRCTKFPQILTNNYEINEQLGHFSHITSGLCLHSGKVWIASTCFTILVEMGGCENIKKSLSQCNVH
jgi:hypothetical protein